MGRWHAGFGLEVPADLDRCVCAWKPSTLKSAQIESRLKQVGAKSCSFAALPMSSADTPNRKGLGNILVRFWSAFSKARNLILLAELEPASAKSF